MEWRLRGLPPALWRQVQQKAGDATTLQRVLLGLLRGYIDGRFDPFADVTPYPPH